LLPDVCIDIDKAQTKIKAIQRRLKGVKEQTAAHVQLLTAVETKLTAAIVAALLSARGEYEAPAPIDQEAKPPADILVPLITFGNYITPSRRAETC
jgi:hypothetical protein